MISIDIYLVIVTPKGLCNTKLRQVKNQRNLNDNFSDSKTCLTETAIKFSRLMYKVLEVEFKKCGKNYCKL